jgi:hypothetical protein
MELLDCIIQQSEIMVSKACIRSVRVTDGMVAGQIGLWDRLD